MGNAQHLRTHTGHRDWHGWLALQSCRSTTFHPAVVISIVVEGALVAVQTGITHVHDRSAELAPAEWHRSRSVPDTPTNFRTVVGAIRFCLALLAGPETKGTRFDPDLVVN
jgi:hypothetical protein